MVSKVGTNSLFASTFGHAEATIKGADTNVGRAAWQTLTL